MSIKCVKCGREDTTYSKPEGGHGCAHCERQALIDPGPEDKRDTITFSVMENSVFEPILVLTKEGMYYKGVFVMDAGAAHKAWMATMAAMQKVEYINQQPVVWCKHMGKLVDADDCGKCEKRAD